MSYDRKLIIFHKDTLPNENRWPDRERDALSQLLVYSETQRMLTDVTRELHGLLDEISRIRDLSPPATTTETRCYDNVMAEILQSRERAKRLYREAMAARMNSSAAWVVLDNVFNDLQRELLRTDGLLELYPRRGFYY